MLTSEWARASFCGGNGDCAEAKLVPGTPGGMPPFVAFRNSARPGEVVWMSVAAWRDFNARARAGEFGLPES